MHTFAGSPTGHLRDLPLAVRVEFTITSLGGGQGEAARRLDCPDLQPRPKTPIPGQPPAAEGGRERYSADRARSPDRGWSELPTARVRTERFNAHTSRLFFPVGILTPTIGSSPPRVLQKAAHLRFGTPTRRRSRRGPLCGASGRGCGSGVVRQDLLLDHPPKVTPVSDLPSVLPLDLPLVFRPAHPATREGPARCRVSMTADPCVEQSR